MLVAAMQVRELTDLETRFHHQDASPTDQRAEGERQAESHRHLHRQQMQMALRSPDMVVGLAGLESPPPPPPGMLRWLAAVLARRLG